MSPICTTKSKVADSSVNTEDRRYVYDAAWPREIL